MTIYVKNGGLWKTVATPYVKISGVWTPIANVYRNISGTWTQVYPGTYLMSGGVTVANSFNPSTGVSLNTVTTTILDINGNVWGTGNGLIQHYYDASPARDDTTIRVAANVSETYWSLMEWHGYGSITRSSRTSFTAWNGTYTQWVFAGNGLNLQPATATMTIYP